MISRDDWNLLSPTERLMEPEHASLDTRTQAQKAKDERWAHDTAHRIMGSPESPATSAASTAAKVAIGTVAVPLGLAGMALAIVALPVTLPIAWLVRRSRQR